ncbi:hypothetical protein ACTXT7_015806 [Hymenolepis weldensis]
MPVHNERDLESYFADLFPDLFGQSSEHCEEESSGEISGVEEIEVEEHGVRERQRRRWVFELVDPRTVPEYYSRAPPRKIIRDGEVYYEGLEPRMMHRPTGKHLTEVEGRRKPSEE